MRCVHTKRTRGLLAYRHFRGRPRRWRRRRDVVGVVVVVFVRWRCLHLYIFVASAPHEIRDCIALHAKTVVHRRICKACFGRLRAARAHGELWHQQKRLERTPSCSAARAEQNKFNVSIRASRIYSILCVFLSVCGVRGSLRRTRIKKTVGAAINWRAITKVCVRVWRVHVDYNVGLDYIEYVWIRCVWSQKLSMEG